MAETRRTLERLTEDERRALARLAWVAPRDLAGILIEGAGQVAGAITDSVNGATLQHEAATVSLAKAKSSPRQTKDDGSC